ncbi:esterase [Ideonella sp. BN130291]|uniref:esterase n=1 Tax=Ideonella sp. BN130291 TaxID=3112940 RepID=UPI002E2592AB|nr:esterase [Ideonella sp. BN130291]
MDPRTAIDYLPASGSPELLFLLFHGVGGQPYDMSPLMDRLAAEYPRAALVALPAPDAFDGVPGGGTGGQWFSIREIHEHNRPLRVAAAMPGFVQVVRAQQQRFGIDWPHTALVGFSQGAIMALEAVQQEPQLAGRVLGFSGRFARLPEHAPVDTTVHLLHGLKDTVVPPGPVVDAARRLVALGGDVTADVLPDIGHELHPLLVERAIDQLRSFLPKRAWREALGEAPVQNRVASSRELGRGGTPE